MRYNAENITVKSYIENGQDPSTKAFWMRVFQKNLEISEYWRLGLRRTVGQK